MSGYGQGPDDPWRSQPQGQPPEQPPGADERPGQYPAAPQYPSAPPYGYGYGPGAGQSEHLPLPPSVHWASILMFVRVGLSVIATIILFTQLDSIIDDAIANAKVGSTVDRDQLHTALTVGGVFALIISALLLWLAILVRQGKNWARIVALVLAGLGIIGGLASFAQASDAALTALNVLSLLAAIPVFVLLLTPSANAYYRSFKAPQY
jgi:hypothetical protein